MSERNVERRRDWFRQAERDLEHARRSVPLDDHEWVCFAAQQAAEKALKGLCEYFGGHGRTYSVVALLEGLEEKSAVPDRLKDGGRILDRTYLPTWYPNGVDHGIPGDYFLLEDAHRAIEESDAILEFVRPQIP